MKLRLLALAICWPLLPLAAQDSLLTPPDIRLRVTSEHRSPRIETGRFHALTDTTLVLARGISRIELPLAGIARLEISRGRKPGIAGGVVGLLLGAAGGGLVACAANRDDYGVFCGGQNDTKVAVGAVLGGVVGAAAGALLFRRERWSVIGAGQLPRAGH